MAVEITIEFWSVLNSRISFPVNAFLEKRIIYLSPNYSTVERIFRSNWLFHGFDRN